MELKQQHKKTAQSLDTFKKVEQLLIWVLHLVQVTWEKNERSTVECKNAFCVNDPYCTFLQA